MAQVADRMAIAVGVQWNAEAAVRRLNDPYPLPVSWEAADVSLTDPWDSLTKLAASGAGWPRAIGVGAWAASPDDLAGAGDELVEVLARVPTGRLIVLGEPGAGKTMLMVRLVLDLLARRAGGGPVPILASVASWDPAAQDLRSWLCAQLVIDYPALASPPPTDREEPTQAAALLASGLILPVLDGLDEIPGQVRGAAINRINDALRPGEQVVVTCRTQQYRDTVRPQDGLEVTLRAAAAVQLCPLDADAVRGYLDDDAAGPVTKARWAPVLTILGTEAPAAQALTTPLMVGLARAIYNPRPGELAGNLRSPAELCGPAVADRPMVESLLFDAFIPAAYRHDPDGRWKAQDAEKWLVFLARHLECTIGGPDLAWWQLPLALPGFALATGVMVGVACGVIFGVMAGVVGWVLVGNLVGATAGAVVGATAAAVLGVVLGALLGMAAARKELAGPVSGIRLRPPGRKIVVWVVFGLVAGAASGAASGPRYGIVSWAVLGALTAVGAGAVIWVSGQNATELDLRSATSPATVFAGDRRTGTALGVVFGVVVGVMLGVVLAALVSIGSGWALGVASGVVYGLISGVVGGAIFIFDGGAWPSYEMARIWLGLRHRLPWPLMDFLVDAHRRGVLRQAGAIYQFRHIELQHRLANRDADQQETDSSAAPLTANR